jgi:tetraacyldisaccharide 4'-kinase
MPALPVVAGADRARCGAYALERLGADCAILDDGFQHVSLHRDLNVLLLDSSRPFGNGRLFPMGPLREPPSALSRADLVVFTRWSERVDGESLRGQIIDDTGEHRVVKTSHRLSGLSFIGDDRDLDPIELRGAPVSLVTAIANPRSFERTVTELGVEVRGHSRFPDHYGFTMGDLSAAALKARAGGARFILTTEKDAVRFPTGARELDPPAVQVRVSIHVEEGWGIIDHMLESLFAEGRGDEPVL